MMDAFIPLTVEDVLEIHAHQIARHGGSAGVRDTALLESAVGAPLAQFGGQFLHADLIEMAAAYLFYLVNNHPFVDGNKRVGAASASTFLKMNDIEFRCTDDELVSLVLAVAQRQMDKAQVINFIRAHARA